MTECPRCGHKAEFSEFTRLGECPSCATALQTLLDVDAGEVER